MEMLHQRSNTKGSPFILWLNMLDSVCLNLWTFSTTFSSAPPSIRFLCSYIKFSLFSFFLIWPLYSGRVQSHSQVPHSCEVHHTCIWSQSLKKYWREIILASSLPFLLHRSSCPIWFNLAPERWGETIWRWGDANNVAPHLKCLKCLWPVGPAFDQELTWWFCRFKETQSRRTGGKTTGAWKAERTHFGVSRGQNNRRKSLFGLFMFHKASAALNCALSF